MSNNNAMNVDEPSSALFNRNEYNNYDEYYDNYDNIEYFDMLHQIYDPESYSRENTYTEQDYKSKNIPTFAYRALRPNEIMNLIRTGKLLPPCTPCPSFDNCCQKTLKQHITAGSKSKVKSPWISLTADIHTAALWASRSDGMLLSEYDEIRSGESSGIFVKINLTGLKVKHPLSPGVVLKGTGRNAAIASKEIAVENVIPWANITNIYNAKQVTDDEYLVYEGGKVYGTKKKTVPDFIHVIWKENMDGFSGYVKQIERAARRGLNNRFTKASEHYGGSKKSKRSIRKKKKNNSIKRKNKKNGSKRRTIRKNKSKK